MNRKLLAALCLVVVSAGMTLSIAVAYQGKFPGKGSLADWERASKVYDQGVDAADEKNYEKAVQLNRSAISIYPHDADFYVSLGVALSSLNRDKDAEAPLRKAIELAPTDFGALCQYGSVLVSEGKFELGRKFLERAKRFANTASEKDTVNHNLAAIHKIQLRHSQR